MVATILKGACFTVAAGWTAVLLGQAPQTQGNKGATAIAVSGCVGKAGSAGATGFVLTKTAAVTLATPGATSDTTVANQAKTPAAQYRLTGYDSMVAPYVDHRVQITGTVEPSTTPKDANSAAASAPTLKVESVMLIAPTCS